MRFALPEGLGAVSGAVLGGSWALLGAVLACLGRQLGAKLDPKRQKVDPKTFQNRSQDAQNDLNMYEIIPISMLGASQRIFGPSCRKLTRLGPH